MKPRRSSLRVAAAALALALGMALLVSWPPANRAASAPAARLVVLSSSDMKGKTSPCGCHTPMGGLARWSGFVDSTRTADGDVLVVVDGGFFPEGPDHEPVASFYMGALARLGAQVVGASEAELHYGLGFLKANLASSHLNMTCANLIETATRRPLLPPFDLQTIGGTKVGVFALASPKADLGALRDSVSISDPAAAARETIDRLHKRGATVIVLLSSLGKVDSEDLVAAVPGVDLVVVGHGVPLYEKGKRIRNTLACYGGEQGQYVGRSQLDLDPRGKVIASDCATYIMGPDVADNVAVHNMVEAFEDALNERQRKRDEEAFAREKAAGTAGTADAGAPHYVGVEVCARCHAAEFAQWKRTAHATAWQTLIDEKKESTSDCVPCHVTGYRKAGGFRTAAETPQLANVQCENCHGMGSEHAAASSTGLEAPVAEATCRGCHDATTSPTFAFDLYRAHVLHQPPANLPPLPPSPAMMKKAAKASGAH